MNTELPALMEYKFRRWGQICLQEPYKGTSGYSRNYMKPLIYTISINPIAMPNTTESICGF
jgi:hypothetical protein